MRLKRIPRRTVLQVGTNIRSRENLAVSKSDFTMLGKTLKVEAWVIFSRILLVPREGGTS